MGEAITPCNLVYHIIPERENIGEIVVEKISNPHEIRLYKRTKSENTY